MITIYWGVDTHTSQGGIRAERPISILQKLLQERNPKDLMGTVEYSRCPAIVEELMNVYGIKSYYDYTLLFGKDNVTSPDYDQEFYNQHLKISSLKGNLFEWGGCNFVFFTEEPSLEMSFLPAYMEDNSVVNNTIMLPGKIDIGKYFRGLQFAFHMKQNCNKIIFNRKEICCYVKFHTKKKFKFKQFFWTPEINEMNEAMLAAKHGKYDFMNLDYFYNLFDKFNFKKKILKIIKQNLCKGDK